MTPNSATPFSYPPAEQSRRHGPAGYADYRSYRPWLRDEFSFRCAYCLIRELWGRVVGEFDLDHFVPMALEEKLENTYDNLVYACHSCNLRKGSRLLPRNGLSGTNVRLYKDGRLTGLTAEAERTIRLLYLNSPQPIQWRRIWLRTIELAHRYDPELYYDLMTYPDDIPDLSQLQAPTNSKPEGVNESYYARRERQELPATYIY